MNIYAIEENSVVIAREVEGAPAHQQPHTSTMPTEGQQERARATQTLSRAMLRIQMPRTLVGGRSPGDRAATT